MPFFDALVAMFRPAATPSSESLAAEEALRKAMLERCQRFKRLLAANKSALEGMAELEERLHGTAPYSISYVRRVATHVGTNVFQMVQSLNALSGNAYAGLLPAFSRISTAIEDILAHSVPQSHGPLVLHLQDMGLENIHQVGGKMANLGEVYRHAGMPVPDGFAVTAAAYHLFMAENGLQEEIDRRIQATNVESLDDVFSLSASVQQLIQSAPMPAALEEAINAAVQTMQTAQTTQSGQTAQTTQTGQTTSAPALRLAVRSSALGEDSLGASFAGQYHSELNVHPDEILDVWRDIVASKYAVTAMHYRFQRGIPDDSIPMCVGVLAMVQAQAGGVAYSRNPLSPAASDSPTAPSAQASQSEIIVNAVLGLPMAVVDGSFSPDVFTLSRSHPPRVLEEHIAHKPFKFVCNAASRIERVPLSEAEGTRPSIDTTMVMALGSLVLALEEYYHEPQDVEWAINADNKLVILQSRPLKQADSFASHHSDTAQTDKTQDADGSLPPAYADLPPQPAYAGLALLLRGGTSVSSGVGMGPVFHARKDADILAFPTGAVLVVERAEPRWATLLSRASALIAEAGGTAGHLASVAREYGVPAIFGLQGALDSLEAGQEVSVDSNHVCVIAGLHPHLCPPASPRNLMEGSPVYQSLHAVAAHIIPLHLLDPAAPEFSPEHCQSLHDITRFCHEKSVDLLFAPSGSSPAADVYAEGTSPAFGKQLKAGVKLHYWVIDTDDGFINPVTKPYVELSNIRSAPMLALWRGMTAIPWNGPPATDASGFMSVVFESTMNRDLEASTASSLSNKNFLMISSTFMNLQARFGYHFCTVESQAGEQAHENYVSFQFKGGAASMDRRVLRAKMVGRLLENYGFRVDVKQDALFATAEGYEAAAILQRTALLGYLVIHTRQVDMVMHNRDLAAALERQFTNDMKHIFTT